MINITTLEIITVFIIVLLIYQYVIAPKLNKGIKTFLIVILVTVLLCIYTSDYNSNTIGNDVYDDYDYYYKSASLDNNTIER